MCNILKWFKSDCLDFTKPEKVVKVKIDSREWMDADGPDEFDKQYIEMRKMNNRRWADLPLYSNCISYQTGGAVTWR